MQYILDFKTLNCKTTENLKSALSFLSKKASISDNSLKNQFFQKIFSAHQVKKTTHILYTNFPTFTQSERWKFHFHFQIHHYQKYSLISQLQIKLEFIFSEEYSTSLFQSFSCQLKTKRLSQIYFYLIKNLICPDQVPLGKSIVSLHQGCKIDPRQGTYKNQPMAVAGVLQWTECQPANQRAAVGFLVRAHAWVAGQVPNRGPNVRGNHTLMLLSFSFPLPSPLSKNKYFF